jgi:hypothetical protein
MIMALALELVVVGLVMVIVVAGVDALRYDDHSIAQLNHALVRVLHSF